MKITRNNITLDFQKQQSKRAKETFFLPVFQKTSIEDLVAFFGENEIKDILRQWLTFRYTSIFKWNCKGSESMFARYVEAFGYGFRTATKTKLTELLIQAVKEGDLKEAASLALQIEQKKRNRRK